MMLWHFFCIFLRPSDLFIDIGANVGSYTILASSEINAKTIAIEPVPSTFENLIDNISINKMQEKVKALNIGLGSKEWENCILQSHWIPSIT